MPIPAVITAITRLWVFFLDARRATGHRESASPSSRWPRGVRAAELMERGTLHEPGIAEIVSDTLARRH